MTTLDSGQYWCDLLPDAVKAMWDAARGSMGPGRYTLVAPAARTLIERVAQDLLGESGNPGEPLRALKDAGFITHRLRRQLQIVVEVGNAVLHRGLELEEADARLILGLIETLLRVAYFPEARVEALRSTIPPRR
ncbi:DUF4145 domain-containing protein [Cystobacter fuscus]|uniref:DUF4145 domain-containing protein n=1 Tax=Cystobacter fuscus TaxID=43 RepID=UPI0037C100BC